MCCVSFIRYYSCPMPFHWIDQTLTFFNRNGALNFLDGWSLEIQQSTLFDFITDPPFFMSIHRFSIVFIPLPYIDWVFADPLFFCYFAILLFLHYLAGRPTPAAFHSKHTVTLYRQGYFNIYRCIDGGFNPMYGSEVAVV